jgi:hypothetical protein
MEHITPIYDKDLKPSRLLQALQRARADVYNSDEMTDSCRKLFSDPVPWMKVRLRLVRKIGACVNDLRSGEADTCRFLGHSFGQSLYAFSL